MPVFLPRSEQTGTTLMVTYLNVERAVAGEPRMARRRPGFLGRDANVANTFCSLRPILLIIPVTSPFALSVFPE